MEYVFVVKVIVSFLIAGLWIAIATLLAENFGSKIGGLITNLPSNILISFLFIAITRDVNYVKEASITVPIGMSIDAIFLLIFISVLRYNLTYSIITSLLIWFILAIIAMKIPANNILINIIVYITVTIISFIIAEKYLKIKSVPRSFKKYSVIQILIRAIFAGSVVASIVVIAKFSNPYFVGIISAFPAVLLSTMVILTINQNKYFAQATGKILILSSTNIIIYSSSVYFTYPKYGIIIGTIASFLLSFFYVWTFIPIIKRIT